MDDRLITIAIHTYERALELKSLLESEGIEAVLQNVNLSSPIISSGVRVRIKEHDLPAALRIIENREIFVGPAVTSLDLPLSRRILVPVDFTPMSIKACKAAFRIAHAHQAEIVLLNAFVDPALTASIQLSDTLDFDVAGAQLRESIAKAAENSMITLCDELKHMIKEGEIPPVKFTREITEGVPEDAINAWAKKHQPMLIVMATRGADKKERELVGSVTAEVLDTSRTPIFTIPESASTDTIERMRHIVFFCTLTQEDMLGLDALSRLFDESMLRVTLLHIRNRKDATHGLTAAEDALLRYCRENYPLCTFEMMSAASDQSTEKLDSIDRTAKINMLAVLNKKKNVFARLFNPGMAHRLLFRADIPMIVIPV
ncbi:universal stress protein [Paramuribaculum intestinale]|uniref:universal stress protein n=2 Tax=Paramuribaculum intestinale TaxID=2094151 RepID=UPI00259C988A|nr:universal stress protein [Paramuribaculum intestinale]